VGMFQATDPILRAWILQAYPGPSFDTADRLTDLLYMFDPIRFAGESYRFHSRPENG